MSQKEEKLIRRRSSRLLAFLLVYAAALFAGCGGDEGDGASATEGGTTSSGTTSSNGSTTSTTPRVPGEPSQDCREVTMTAYDAGLGGMCQYENAFDVLPEFVQRNLTLAIAEPFAGGSLEGDFAESCGECWEITTITSTEIVMVTNLCPANEDNPVCAGDTYHFDISREAGEALGHEGITIGQARPVPCPVTGNVHAVILGRNDFFLRLAFANHRFTIRTAEYRIDGTDEWLPLRRDGGAWALNDANDAIGPDAPGIAFRLTSPTGDVMTGPGVLPYAIGEGMTFDLGAQFDERTPEGGSCTYIPDGTVYSDGFGGSAPVQWELNSYGGAQAAESSDGCTMGTSCVRVTNYERFSGAVFRINDALPVGPYRELSLMLRGAGGSGTVEIQVGAEGGNVCDSIEVDVSDAWATPTVDLTTGCDGVPEWGRIALINRTDPFELIVDEVVFR
ncbi:MAG: hypothetical protein AAGA56_18395 [Myxococcota bacterium]